jgi:hypothetical protein
VPSSPVVSCMGALPPFHRGAASSLHLSSATRTTTPRQNLHRAASHGTCCRCLHRYALPPRMCAPCVHAKPCLHMCSHAPNHPITLSPCACLEKGSTALHFVCATIPSSTLISVAALPYFPLLRATMDSPSHCIALPLRRSRSPNGPRSCSPTRQTSISGVVEPPRRAPPQFPIAHRGAHRSLPFHPLA